METYEARRPAPKTAQRLSLFRKLITFVLFYRMPGHNFKDSKMRNFWQKYHLEIGIVSALILLLVVLACGLFSSVARAVEPGWYAPDDNGEGLIVRCGSGGCAMAWLTHGKDAEQIWLISTETCPRESAVCELQMSETTGLWRGLGGETEIADPTVEIEVRQTEEGVTLDWDARQLFPASCFDIGSGGLLLAGCVGQKRFDLLAR